MKWLVRLAGIVVIVGLGLALASCQPRIALEAGQRITAQEAWEVMQPNVTRWKAGSEIISARPPSRPGREDLDTDGRSSAWRFVVAPVGDPVSGIYSLDTTARPIQVDLTEQRRPVAPASLDPANWAVDSDEAMDIALANGLQQWMDENPGLVVRTMTFELISTVELGSHWRIEGRVGQNTFQIRINAVDGSVIDVTGAP
jgi:hypothetical protein